MFVSQAVLSPPESAGDGASTVSLPFGDRLRSRTKYHSVNLPIGAIVIPVVAFYLPRSIDTPTEGFKGKSWWQIVARFDPAGTIVFLISIICLVLALQWGGTRYPWSDTRVIVTMVVFSVLFVIWIILQWVQGDNATIPKDIITQRSVVGATIYTLCGAAAFTIVVYYLPLW